MLKAVKQLVNHERRTVGNHYRECYGDKEFFYYHWTAICVVNYGTREFYVDNGGFRTSSTTRAINSYKQAFPYFKEITKEEAHEKW